MSYVNDEIKSTESTEPNACRHEKKCYIQDKFGQEQEVCPDCLFVEDRDY